MKIEDVFYKLRPVMGRQLDALWQEYLVADVPLRKTIEKVLRVQLARKLGETYESEQVLLKPPPRELAEGEYSIGTIHYGKDQRCEFGLRKDEFIQHIGIFGRSGSGKTNLAYIILDELVRAGKPFLVFDWKRNYRDLLGIGKFSDTLVFTVARDVSPFRFNPLIPPPGTSAKTWSKKLIEVISHAYYGGEGFSIILLRAIDSLYESHGLYDGKFKRYPTIADVRKWLNDYRAKGRERGWMESAMRAVETLCFGEVGNVLNAGPFFDIPGLLNKRVVLELDALTNADKTFLIETMLLWIHHYRLAQKDREDFKHVIVIEEAHHVLLRKKTEATGEESVTDVILREIRELGEGVICLDQHPSLISKPALGNTYATFVFNLKHRGDLAMMQDCLLLTGEQADYLGRLEVGWAVVKLQGRWFWPFLVKLPLMKVRKGEVTDTRLREIAKERQKEYSCLLSHYKGCSAEISGQSKFSSSGSTPDEGIPPLMIAGKTENIRDTCAIELTTQEMNFLMDVWQYPTSTVTERYRRLSVSSRRGNKIQKSLLESAFISFSFIATPKGRLKILTLTNKGREALRIAPAESNRHGGPEHKYWVNRVAEHLQKHGYEVLKEAPVGGGKTIDIVAERNGRRIAFEVETGKSDVVANVQKCLDASMDEIVIIATSTPLSNGLRGALPKRDKVKIQNVCELVEQNKLTD